MLDTYHEYKLLNYKGRDKEKNKSKLVNILLYLFWFGIKKNVLLSKGQLRVILPALRCFQFFATVCFMNGLSIYEIKRRCYHAQFFIISNGSFNHFTNFLKTKTINFNICNHHPAALV